jgi:hypothetical protein
LRIPAPSRLVINEILPRPRRGGPHREFVEIHNTSDKEASIDGMFLTDTRRDTTKFRISWPAPIPPHGFLVILADGRGEGIRANFHLGNAGEYLGLFARAEEGNVLVDQVAYPSIPVDKSYGREGEATKNWRVWKDPTPGARNIPKIPPEYLKKDGAGAPAEGKEPAAAEKDLPEPPGDEMGEPPDEDEGEDAGEE